MSIVDGCVLLVCSEPMDRFGMPWTGRMQPDGRADSGSGRRTHLPPVVQAVATGFRMTRRRRSAVRARSSGCCSIVLIFEFIESDPPTPGTSCQVISASVAMKGARCSNTPDSGGWLNSPTRVAVWD
jgi:hypothetical protein